MAPTYNEMAPTYCIIALSLRDHSLPPTMGETNVIRETTFKFPQDLELLIFEIAAFSAPGSALQLATLSRDVCARCVVNDCFKNMAPFNHRPG